MIAIIERGSYFERCLILWNMVKVPRQIRTTTKGKTLSWDLREGYLRSLSFKENVSIVGSNVTNLLIVDYQKLRNLRKLM